MENLRAIFRLVCFAVVSLLALCLIFSCKALRLNRIYWQVSTASSVPLHQWIAHKLYGFLASICGVVVHHQNVNTHHQSLGPRRRLFIANHISYLDIIGIATIFPTSFIAKAEVYRWPIIGLITKLVDCIFVERLDTMNRALALRKLTRKLPHHDFCVFPEGTTTSGRLPSKEWSHGQLKAIEPGKTEIICIGISYEDQDAIAWIDSAAFFPHLWKVFKRKKTHCYMRSTSFYVTAEQYSDLRKLGKLCRQKIVLLCETLHHDEEEAPDQGWKETLGDSLFSMQTL